MNLNELQTYVKKTIEELGDVTAIEKFKARYAIPPGTEYDEEAENHDPVMGRIIYDLNPTEMADAFCLIIDNIKMVDDKVVILGLVITLMEMGDYPFMQMNEKNAKKCRAQRGSIYTWFKQRFPGYMTLA